MYLTENWPKCNAIDIIYNSATVTTWIFVGTGEWRNNDQFKGSFADIQQVLMWNFNHTNV